MKTPKSYDTTVQVTKVSSGNQSVYVQKSIEETLSHIEETIEDANAGTYTGYANKEGTLNAKMFFLATSTIKVEEVQ